MKSTTEIRREAFLVPGMVTCRALPRLPLGEASAWRAARHGETVKAWFPGWNLFWGEAPSAGLAAAGFGAPEAVVMDPARGAGWIIVPEDAARLGQCLAPGDVVRLKRAGAGPDLWLRRAGSGWNQAVQTGPAGEDEPDGRWVLLPAPPGRCGIVLADPAAPRLTLAPYKGLLETTTNEADVAPVMFLRG
ncbi:hypothetical protein OG2516_03183 [Oceanicola granulosus HTCC2516]|uniref:Uncharacterized protein n=1 Tax=Oceanicola granulosus (strain ATCC BAA-861 / DSM 15982 / KCTC 12143 / HTCC2516) TaxID=314256 RepID=Q2CE89_OCEGH|nr:hypothetical protein [Oceanicola granulosus]EAR50971.1 hypothetical protein OG2516_03183 [Oceanicola granulosus HTCC2516]